MGGGEERERQRMGKSAMKSCLLHMTRLPHSHSRSECHYPQKMGLPQHPTINRRRANEAPLSLGSYGELTVPGEDFCDLTTIIVALFQKITPAHAHENNPN